jgi:hypothetical protein
MKYAKYDIAKEDIADIENSLQNTPITSAR